MPYQKLTFKPGVYKDDSPLEAEGYWIDTDKIRFVRGLPETIYGWEKASNSTLLGICRGAMTWADNGRNPFAAFGTHLRLYAMDVDGNITDITPVTSRTNESISFTTTNASTTVTMTRNSHGLVVDQKFQILNSSVSSVGGVTLNGTYVIDSVTDTNNVTFTAAQTATSSAGPTAATVDYYVSLAPGQTDGLGGLGYGTGGFGTGGFGGSASGYTLYPRTWSLAQWGQNLIANPRGGGIYEWAPNVTASNLVTNGTFTGNDTGWTKGTGWAYGTNNEVATTASSDLSQNITLPVGAWCLLVTNVSAYTAGTIQPKIGGTSIGSTIGVAGKDFRTFFSGAGGTQSLAYTGVSASLTVDDIDVEVLTVGNPITNAPTAVTCVFTTAERILVACGCADANGNFDALRVRWTDQMNNQTWTAASSNLAGSYTLANGSRIVRGIPGNRENVIMTDTALYAMRYVPDPNVVYSFTEIASGCGLIGPNAITQIGGIFYWMDAAGGFWSYDGSYPQALQCTLARDVRDNLSFVQQDKVYAVPVTVNGRLEVWWFYPDIRDGNECSRYVSFAITESRDQGAPVWFNGTFTRTAWTNAGVFQYPLAVDTAGSIWFHEKGFTEDGGARSWSATTAYFDLADDGTHMRYRNIQADVEDMQGGFSLTINSRIRTSQSAGALVRSFGPYNITNPTAKTNVRANGEESQLVFSGNSAPAFWRLGAFRHELEKTMRIR